MRDIKFRGKRIDNGEWVIGDYFKFMLDEARKEGVERVTHHAISYFNDKIHIFNNVSVDPETICQYTGLKDKNGKEIFEGDICEDARKFRFIVIWDDDNARFLGREIGKQKDYIKYVGQEPAVEIIGNIHDNSELLTA